MTSNSHCFMISIFKSLFFPIGSLIDLIWTLGMIHSECKTELRFDKHDLDSLFHCLRIPQQFVCQQRTVCNGMEALCIFLKRLAYPCRYTDMVPRFGRNPTELCIIFNTVLDFIYANHSHRLQNWNLNPFLQPHKLNEYAVAIHNHGAPLNNCFGFIDGTVRPIARPKTHQRPYVQRTQESPWNKVPECCHTKWADCQSMWPI